VLDPTFVGLVVVAGREESVVGVAAAHLLWILVSQAPLIALMVATARGRHERAVTWFRRVWDRVRPVASILGTGALILAGALFALDSLWWFVTERFLIPVPE
jgi:cytochrome c biogenesis protein CcdA